MKQLLIYAAIVAASLPTAWPAARKGTAADGAAIRGVITAYNEARNAANVKALMELYAPDAQQIEKDGHVSADGRAAIEKRTETLFGNPIFKETHATREVTNVSFLAPDLALVTVTATVTRPGEQGGLLMDVDVMRREDGKWLIASQHNLALREPLATATRQKK
jgi:uncharacterized protein (TIGR02246 family)